MKRVLVLAMLAACSDTSTTSPTLKDLDHPVDIAFACYGGLRITNGGAADANQEIAISAQPIASCDIQSEALAGTEKDKHKAPGQEKIGTQAVPDAAWYGFIVQSAPGTVALARFPTQPSASFGSQGGAVSVLDADPLTPGKNAISVGEDPIAIATSREGCYAVIANQGSCDLSYVDVKSAADSADGIGKPRVTRLDVKTPTGQVVRARPAAMAFEPPGGVIGQRCPDTPTGLAYIAYPNCHLVAAVDVSTGTVVKGISFDALGVPTVIDGTAVSCPAECDGDPPTPGVRPVALDVEVDPRLGSVKLAIGSDNSNVLTVFELDTTQYLPFSQVPSVVFEKPPGRELGITSVAVTPLIGMGGNLGSVNDDLAPGGDMQFVYAVATDGTVRVAKITGTSQECDTQVDPRFLRKQGDISLLSCFPVGATTTPPRRPGARGPGIELTGDGVPTSVDIFRVDDGTGRQQGEPARLMGYFAVVSATDGRSYVVNIDDDDHADSFDPANPLSAPIPLDIAHQLRDSISDRGLEATEDLNNQAFFVCDNQGPDPDAQTGNAGGPRIVGLPQHNLPSGVIALEKTGGLPSIRQVLCDATLPGAEDRPVTELSFAAPIPVRDAEFPDLRGMRNDEIWWLTWEGTLSLDKPTTAVDGPPVRYGTIAVDPFGMHLVDDTHAFCDAGVEPYDIVQLRGCDPSIGDAGCPLGYTCYVHPQSQVTGIGACMLASEAERLSTACKDFLTSQRRYTVGRTKAGELQLLPRKVVLRTTPLDGCVDNQQCSDLATYAASNASSIQPVDDMTPRDTHNWSCEADPDRAPIGGTGKRCVLRCATNADCTFGAICRGGDDAFGGYCMESVVPPQACVNAPQRFELRASEAFAVVGTRSGYMHSIVADANGNCVKNPTGNPYMTGRIPLVAPACDPTADPITGQRMDGTFEPNPCSLTVPETEYHLNYVPGTCTLGNPDESIITRDAQAIRLRNRAMTLTLVDPSYPGDARCNGDRAGTLQNVPLVVQGYSIQFRQTAGFNPLLVPIQPSFPIKVVRGPQQSIWVVDEGDYLSTSVTQSSTRGKVFRVESRALAVVNLLQ